MARIRLKEVRVLRGRERFLNKGIKDCNVTKNWFVELGDSVKERFSKVRNSKLDKEKEIELRKL